MMNVIPVINCPDASCAAGKADIIKTFLPQGSFVHIDVTDGIFSAHPTWNDPFAAAKLFAPFLLEVHLMVTQPEEHADNWLTAGAKRLVIHMETVTPESLRQLLDLAEVHRADVMLSTGPGTDPETLLGPLLHRFGTERLNAFQVLAVPPGDAGQPFGYEAIARTGFLRQTVPHATIEVDGGMDPATARLVKAAGADTIVSSHYLFGAADPKKAYEELCRI